MSFDITLICSYMWYLTSWAHIWCVSGFVLNGCYKSFIDLWKKKSFSHLRYFLCYTFTGFGCNGFTKNDEGSHGLFLGTGLWSSIWIDGHYNVHVFYIIMAMCFLVTRGWKFSQNTLFQKIKRGGKHGSALEEVKLG